MVRARQLHPLPRRPNPAAGGKAAATPDETPSRLRVFARTTFSCSVPPDLWHGPLSWRIRPATPSTAQCHATEISAADVPATSGAYDDPARAHRRGVRFGRWRRNPGGYQDGHDARRPCDDGDHRDHRAEHARRAGGPSHPRRYRRGADAQRDRGYRRRRGQDRHDRLGGYRACRRRSARTARRADRLRSGDGVDQRRDTDRRCDDGGVRAADGRRLGGHAQYPGDGGARRRGGGARARMSRRRQGRPWRGGGGHRPAAVAAGRDRAPDRQAPRHPDTHGTGCTFASALATGLASGLGIAAAFEQAVRFVRIAIVNAPGLGGGHGPIGHTLGVVPFDELEG